MKIVKYQTVCLVAILMVLQSGSITGQNVTSEFVGDSLVNKRLEEVVITANRFSNRLIDTPEAISVIKSDKVDKFQQRTSPEALMLVPGVFVQKTNHGGGSPFLRGLTGNQTLMMIDGIRMSNSTMRYGPNQYLNTIDVFSMEKIEVLKGSGSVQYGSDAMGGTIQVFSKDPAYSLKPDWSSSVLTRFATEGMEQSLHARVDYGHRKAAFTGGITLRNFGDLVGGDTTGRQNPTAYKELDFDLKGKVLFAPGSELTMAFQRVHQQGVPVYHKVELENYALNEMDPQERNLGYLKFKQGLNSGIWKSFNVALFFQKSEEVRKSQKNGSTITRSESDKVRTIGFSSELLSSHGSPSGSVWTSSSGIEVYYDLVNSLRTDTDVVTNEALSKRGLYPDGSTFVSLAAFTNHSYRKSGWIFTAGARFNSFIINVEDETIGSTKITPSALVGNIAVMRRLYGKSNVFVSVNTGFRAPNIDDLGTLGIVDFRYETPNFNLKPEHSLQFQAGYKYNGTKLNGEIYFYRNNLSDLIVRTRMDRDSIEGYPVYTKENVEEVFIHGIETVWNYEFYKNWLLSGTLTYTYGQNITRDEPARRIPPLFGRVSLEYNFRNLWAGIEYQAAGKQDRLAKGDTEDNRIPVGGTPAWNVVNIHTGYSWKFMKFNLSLNNIFNVDYRYHGSGVNGVGRSALLGVMVNL